MRKALLFLPILFFTSCGDLFLGDKLIEEREVIPGLVHSAGILGQIGDQLIVHHGVSVYKDIKPLGKCEEPLRFDSEFLLLDFDGNYSQINSWDDLQLNNFMSIDDNFIAFETNLHQSKTNQFRYGIISENLNLVQVYQVDFDSVKPEGYTFSSSIKVRDIEGEGFMLLGTMNNRQMRKFWSAQIKKGEIAKIIFSEEFQISESYAFSEVIGVGESYFFMNWGGDTEAPAKCYKISFDENNISPFVKDISVQIASRWAFRWNGSIAFLAKEDNAVKIKYLDDERKIFVEDNVSSPTFPLGTEYLIVVWSSNEDIVLKSSNSKTPDELFVITGGELRNYGPKLISNYCQFGYKSDGTLVGLYNVGRLNENSEVRIREFKFGGGHEDKLIFEGVGYRRSCNWD